MPRRKINLEDPDDAQSVVGYIEAKAQQSQSNGFSTLLNDESKPIILDPILRQCGAGSRFEITTYAQKVASACHIRGQVAQKQCNNCQQGRGPFVACVQLSGYEDLTKGCCSNCQFDVNTSKRHSPNGLCDFATNRPHQSRIVRISRPHSADRAPIESQHNPAMRLLHFVNSPEANHVLKPDDIHILGNLNLPDPSSEAQGEELSSILNSVLPHIQALEKRDMKTIKKPIADIDCAFSRFKIAEAQSWIDSGHQPQPLEFLVKPSGLFTSTISHRLNQTSFTTNVPKNGETADPTNGCISMVMNTAFNKNSTLIYDVVHRRSNASDGLKDYPPKVLQAHEDFTRQVSESSEAKVEVVYGRKAQQAIMCNPEIKSTPLPLWDRYSGIVIHFIHETYFRNAQEGYKFRRAIVFAHHPQKLFYDPLGGPFVEHQERSIAMAASMARVDHIPNYYSHKLWDKTGLSSHKRHENVVLAHLDKVSIENFEDVEDNTDSTSNASGSACQYGNWEKFFKKNPHSNSMLIKLLPDAIKAVTTPVTPDWMDPSTMALPALKWWEGQKQILFYNVTVSGLDDILLILDRTQQLDLPPSLMEAIDRTSLQQVLGRLMLIQKYRLEESNGRALKYRWVDVVHSRFDGRSIPVKCIICGQAQKDKKNAIFSVNRPSSFVSMGGYYCRTCEKKADFVPIDDSMPFIYTGTNLLSTAPAIVQRESYKTMLLSAEDRTPHQTQPVESVCIRCRENTLLFDGSRVYVDKQPLWTLGNIRPLYVERRPDCLNCKHHALPTGRFIPKDPAIPSIYHQILSSLAELYGGYDDCIKANLMDHWPPANVSRS